MTATEVVDLIRKNLGVPWNEKTFRDTFKVGDPALEVKGIATTCMSTLNTIQRAHAAGANMVISHEPTFWSDADSTAEWKSDPVYQAKDQYCRENGMVVWRFHDHWHARKPDMEYFATARLLGFAKDPQKDVSSTVYTIAPTTLAKLAAEVGRRIGSHALRVVGDPAATVSSVLLGVGSGMPRANPGADVVIGGEGIESDGAFDNTEYVRDAVALGVHKGLIILGHVLSEEPGMEQAAVWLRTFIPGIPVKFVPAGEPFQSLG